ncbi:unnamed protein product [Chrysodeixis includens]|uniref:Uncharacterized protein n=1 Tax=Chrysodeixis includens TaxID=689277 RepID=A0A9N8PXQ1_CHRIL|nr:unnamed protein product [Chrysodeixis includens]
MKIGRLTAKVRGAGECGQQPFVGRRRASVFGCSYWQVAPPPRGVAARPRQRRAPQSLSAAAASCFDARPLTRAAPASRLPRFHVRLSNSFRIAPGARYGPVIPHRLV